MDSPKSTLYLSQSAPPPAYNGYPFGIVGKEGRHRVHVVAIPSVLEGRNDITNNLFVT
jgi:hypothetical protein